MRLMGPAAVDYTTWGRHKAAAAAVADALREVGEVARAARLDWCGRTVEAIRCGDCGSLTYRAALCHDRACPVCSWRRSRREYARLMGAVRRAPHGRWVHVTLTLPAHVSTSLSAGLDLLTAAWGRWCRSILRGSLGWWRRVEVTRGPAGWHPHMHVLLLLPEGADLDPARVAAAWGRACRLDRAPLVGIRSWGAREVPRLVRYLTSDDHGAAGLDGPVLTEWLGAVRSRRFLASKGSLSSVCADPVATWRRTADRRSQTEPGGGTAPLPDGGAAADRMTRPQVPGVRSRPGPCNISGRYGTPRMPMPEAAEDGNAPGPCNRDPGHLVRRPITAPYVCAGESSGSPGAPGAHGPPGAPPRAGAVVALVPGSGCPRCGGRVHLVGVGVWSGEEYREVRGLAVEDAVPDGERCALCP